MKNSHQNKNQAEIEDRLTLRAIEVMKHTACEALNAIAKSTEVANELLKVVQKLSEENNNLKKQKN